MKYTTTLTEKKMHRRDKSYAEQVNQTNSLELAEDIKKGSKSYRERASSNNPKKKFISDITDPVSYKK
jgi:hypothetical protein